MIGARGDYPESGAASDDLAGLIHLSNGPIEHDAWLPRWRQASSSSGADRPRMGHE